MAVTRDQVVWAYRLLLQREPESDGVIQDNITTHEDRIDLILAIIKSEEFKEKYAGRLNPT